MPGWASELPLRRLLVELAGAASGGSSEKMRHAVQVLTQMNGSGIRYFDANPEAARAIESYGRVPPKYLAHEFFNETWQPFYSIDALMKWLTPERISSAAPRSQTTIRCCWSMTPP
ncbi:MAG: hypothetical protein WDO56_27960 [Gammaproteobacteria bacterium]